MKKVVDSSKVPVFGDWIKTEVEAKSRTWGKKNTCGMNKSKAQGFKIEDIVINTDYVVSMFPVVW